MDDVGAVPLEELRALFLPLIGLKVDWLSIPEDALVGFEPSQIAVIVNTLLDAALPQIKLLATDPDNVAKLEQLGLTKASRLIGEREGYPDYEHKSGIRVELKGLFIDSPDLELKRPPTKREPSARVKENVTADVIDDTKDVLLVAATQIQCENGFCSPVIIDIDVYPMKDVVAARDKRLAEAGGRWNGKVPQVVSRKGAIKLRKGLPLDEPTDYEKDTNFGKLKRIPYWPLQKFMRKYKTL